MNFKKTTITFLLGLAAGICAVVIFSGRPGDIRSAQNAGTDDNPSAGGQHSPRLNLEGTTAASNSATQATSPAPTSYPSA